VIKNSATIALGLCLGLAACEGNNASGGSEAKVEVETKTEAEVAPIECERSTAVLPLGEERPPLWDSLFNRTISGAHSGPPPPTSRLGHHAQFILGYPERFSITEDESPHIRFAAGLLGESAHLAGVVITDAVSGDEVRRLDFAASERPPLRRERCWSFYQGGCRFEGRLQLAPLPVGVFVVVLYDDRGAESHPITLNVRARHWDESESLVVMFPNHTWHAYNRFGGGTLYKILDPDNSEKATFLLPDRLYSVSQSRPLLPLEKTPHHKPEGTLVFLRALREADIPYRAISNSDLDDEGRLPRTAKVLLIGTHDEYWTASMQASVKKFIRDGGNLAYLGGNAAWWQINRDGPDLYRDGYSGAKECPPMRSRNWANIGNFHSTLVNKPSAEFLGMSYRYAGRPTKQKVRPEDAADHGLTAQQYDNSGGVTITAPEHPVFADTGLVAGDIWGADMAILGIELDGVPLDPDGTIMHRDRAAFPPTLEILASALAFKGGVVHPVGIFIDARPYPGGGRVIAFGSIAFYKALAVGDKIGVQLFENVMRLLLSEDH
jgi:hypothetical protein